MPDQTKSSLKSWFKRLIANYDEFLKSSGLDQKGGCGCLPPARYDPQPYSAAEKKALAKKQGGADNSSEASKGIKR